jgi:hypothetical protein
VGLCPGDLARHHRPGRGNSLGNPLGTRSPNDLSLTLGIANRNDAHCRYAGVRRGALLTF